MPKDEMIPRLAVSVLALVAVAGCTTTNTTVPTTPNSYKREANEAMAKQSTAASRHHPAEVQAKLRALWSDNGEALQLIDDGRDLAAPKMLAATMPVYPPGPRITTSVVVTSVIDESGRPTETRIYQPSEPRFNQAALNAVSSWRFSPAKFDNRPVKTLIMVPIEFRPN